MLSLTNFEKLWVKTGFPIIFLICTEDQETLDTYSVRLNKLKETLSAFCRAPTNIKNTPITHTHTRMRWFSGNRRFGSETGDMNFTPLSRCVFIRCPQKHCNKWTKKVREKSYTTDMIFYRLLGEK